MPVIQYPAGVRGQVTRVLEAGSGLGLLAIDVLFELRARGLPLVRAWLGSQHFAGST